MAALHHNRRFAPIERVFAAASDDESQEEDFCDSRSFAGYATYEQQMAQEPFVKALGQHVKKVDALEDKLRMDMDKTVKAQSPEAARADTKAARPSGGATRDELLMAAAARDAFMRRQGSRFGRGAAFSRCPSIGACTGTDALPHLLGRAKSPFREAEKQPEKLSAVSASALVMEAEKQPEKLCAASAAALSQETSSPEKEAQDTATEAAIAARAAFLSRQRARSGRSTIVMEEGSKVTGAVLLGRARVQAASA
eukprot:TRINITY_DN4362_c0_g1_i4.p1 TRINITY_DN4362_c0_g1~~TRINITY_DN4362_c0_g1_i4.p1  ORF type:complete len:286 (+),score=57.21 TRINITY_DN4362_c0_g1_i4:98-859(+)